jgi:molybdate transport system ATP-binding protein
MGEGELLAGTIKNAPPIDKVEAVSFEVQSALIEQERSEDDSRILDVIDAGSTAEDILTHANCDADLLPALIERFGLAPLLHRSFSKLSTGETRKLLIVRALASHPQLLILDEPFDGLDVETTALLQAELSLLAKTQPMLLVLNRWDEIPEFVTHIAYMYEGELQYQVSVSEQDKVTELAQLLHLKTTELAIPGPSPESNQQGTSNRLNSDQPLVHLKQAVVRYGDKTIFENIDWRIEPGEHWQLFGPNGSGKTCLLNLITGDHPQCYNNDIFVFGYQRGQGESIWDIKQHIGYVSTALQWEYRVSISLLNVIVSGFYDSIGVYQKPSSTEKETAREWLAVLGMEKRANEPFNKLSFGDQRMLLIARAMVKHPALLILDEPCLGLDDMNRSRVLAMIEKVCAGTETTVLYVNHHAQDKIAGIHRSLDLGKLPI